jgi:hypothetical protein
MDRAPCNVTELRPVRSALRRGAAGLGRGSDPGRVNLAQARGANFVPGIDDHRERQVARPAASEANQGLEGAASLGRTDPGIPIDVDVEPGRD